MAGKEDDADTTAPKVASAEAVAESAAPILKHECGAAEPEAAHPDEDAVESGVVDKQRNSAKTQLRRVSVSVRTLLVAALITALLASEAVLIWLYVGSKTKADEEVRRIANNDHAEQIALDYAVDAAKINAQELDTWKRNLVKGTTPELTEKLNSAAKSMEQILVPLQWNSTAIPLVAKVRSSTNGVYVVDSFVGVNTKTVQSPDGVQSTASYNVTIDSNHDWQISDVGGMGSVVAQK